MSFIIITVSIQLFKTNYITNTFNPKKELEVFVNDVTGSGDHGILIKKIFLRYQYFKLSFYLVAFLKKAYWAKNDSKILGG